MDGRLALSYLASRMSYTPDIDITVPLPDLHSALRAACYDASRTAARSERGLSMFAGIGIGQR